MLQIAHVACHESTKFETDLNALLKHLAEDGHSIKDIKYAESTDGYSALILSEEDINN